MTQPVTAYLTHRPWNAADGDKLFGGFTRVIQHGNAPTGLVHRFEIRERSSAGDKTKAGRVKARAEPRKAKAPRWDDQREAAMPTQRGWLTRTSGTITKADENGERTFVMLRCKCERTMQVRRGDWCNDERAPESCGRCVKAYKRACTPAETTRRAA